MFIVDFCIFLCCFTLFHPVSPFHPLEKLLSDLQYFAAPRHTWNTQSKSHQRIRNRSNAGLERPGTPASSNLEQKEASLTLIYETCIDLWLYTQTYHMAKCGMWARKSSPQGKTSSWITQPREFTHRGAWKLGTKFGATVLRNGFAGSGSTLGTWLLLFRPIKLT